MLAKALSNQMSFVPLHIFVQTVLFHDFNQIELALNPMCG